MANIRVDLNGPIVNGQSITFKSPANCADVTGLIVYYLDNGSTSYRVFQFADSHGTNVGGKNLFASDVLVKVILHTEFSRAYVQNADTSAYLEAQLAQKYSLHDRGTKIPDGDDLDNYVTPGVYYVMYSTNAEKIKNAPTNTSGFKLVVEKGHQGDGHVFHTATASDSRVYKRELHAGKWDGWSRAYDSAHPPDAVDVGARPADWTPDAASVGALALDGSGTMTGDLTIRKENDAPRVILDRGTSGAEVRLSSIDNTAVLQAKEGGATAFRQLRLASTKRSPAGSLKDVLQLYSTVSGEGTKSFLHTGNISEHGVAKIETGSYVGTGTCGVDHPTELTFSFVPKMVWVWRHFKTASGSGTYPTRFDASGQGYMIACSHLTSEYSQAYYEYSAYITFRNKLDDTTLSFYCGAYEYDDEEEEWYYTSSVDQLNASGQTYHYMAIG